MVRRGESGRLGSRCRDVLPGGEDKYGEGVVATLSPIPIPPLLYEYEYRTAVGTSTVR